MTVMETPSLKGRIMQAFKAEPEPNGRTLVQTLDLLRIGYDETIKLQVEQTLRELVGDGLLAINHVKGDGQTYYRVHTSDAVYREADD